MLFMFCEIFLQEKPTAFDGVTSSCFLMLTADLAASSNPRSQWPEIFKQFNHININFDNNKIIEIKRNFF